MCPHPNVKEKGWHFSFLVDNLLWLPIQYITDTDINIRRHRYRCSRFLFFLHTYVSFQCIIFSPLFFIDPKSKRFRFFLSFFCPFLVSIHKLYIFQIKMYSLVNAWGLTLFYISKWNRLVTYRLVYERKTSAGIFEPNVIEVHKFSSRLIRRRSHYSFFCIENNDTE